MYGSSDDEPDRAKSRLSIESVDTWRTGDGDEETMNTLRTKRREKEPSISPSWKFADVVIPKNTEDRNVTKPKQKNRFSFLVDSTDEDEPHTKPVNGTDMNNGLSRFDGFVRESLSPERSKPSMPVSRKKSEPVSERIARPSTAAQSGSARREQARSRSRSQDRDLRKGSAKDDGSRRASYLDDLIQPSAPRAIVPSAPQPREKRSAAPQMDQHARPKATKPTVAPKPNSKAAKESERVPENSRYSHSRTPSPEKSPEIRKQSLTRSKETPPRRASTHIPGNYSTNQQDVKRAHQRRSRSPSPNTADILERYHDAYPDDAAAMPSPFAEDWSSRRSSRYSRDKTSPLSGDLQSPKISSQNGRVGSLSEAPKGDYYSPTTAVQLRERRADEPPDDRRVKRKSLSLAGMSNPERISTDDDGDRLRRLIMSTEALERRFFTP
ncbi:serine/arginine repetitive matrix protein 1-like [Amphibalanus amphitrite]|uniref:serine/arginine repetitive matrix protein 1-like n=1 Tax=Amphibalanus amphitrite TaxID=1232801 RepID=UPI001C902CC2|nr:serine/arginine repetitive matrix protein 1-like [Amphibalanus amphitrite]